jgi:uncharacterized protein (DUF1800 family)
VVCLFSIICTVSIGTLYAAPQGQSSGWGEYPNQPNAARFLEYSTWGSNQYWISYLEAVGLQRFLEWQFSMPASSYPTMPLYPAQAPADCDATCRRDNYTLYPLQTRFYRNALYAQDQLRQRVAFALHQIVVVSGVEITQPSRLTPYLQILDNNAFGNFRQLLYEITLNPAMGNYLDMAGNTAANPNENYAREILQLFSIGLYELNEDGSLVIGSDGQPVPAYDQSVVNAFARVFTGWNFAPAPAPGLTNYIDPMVAAQNRHDIQAKTLLKGVTLPPNQTAVRDLNAALDNIFNHPNVGPFIGRQLIQHLVTSNPSPDYVRRVSRVFADNGLGVRGDLKAVVTAILMDPEAAANPAPDVSKGRLRHPIFYVTSLMRNFNATSADGLALSDGYLNPQNQNMGMDLFVPPSVFSYFPPPTLVLASNMAGPEFGLLNTSTALRRANFINTMVFSRVAVSANSPNGTALDFTYAMGYASQPEQLVGFLNVLMMGGNMSPAMAEPIVAAVNAVPVTNPLRRVQTAVYLVATSAQYQVAR